MARPERILQEVYWIEGTLICRSRSVAASAGVMLGSSAIFAVALVIVKMTQVASRDLRLRCIVTRLPCLMFAERYMKGRPQTEGLLRSQYLLDCC